MTDELIRAAPGTGEGWITYGRDWSNQRYAPQAEINRQKVVLDDLLIYTDADTSVIAMDARTGREHWRYHPKLGSMALCCGVVNRGVAIYGDRVYLATSDADRRNDGAGTAGVRTALKSHLCGSAIRSSSADSAPSLRSPPGSTPT